MNKNRLSVLAAAMLLTLAGQSAHASVSAASTTYSMNFHVVDLTPNDGIAAGFDIVAGTSRTYAWIGERWGNVWFRDSSYHDLPQASTIAGQYQGAAVNASASPIGGTAAAGFGTGAVDGDASAVSSLWWQLVLAPNTALVVSGRYDITADVDRGEREWKYVNANGSINIYGYGGGYWFREDDEHGTYPSDNGSIGKDYSFSLANTGSSGMDAYISVLATADARSYLNSIPAVPEPSTWLMLGAGLAIAGTAARRRGRHTGRAASAA